MKRIRLLSRWTWGRYVVRRCPACGCTPDDPCTIRFPDGESTAACVPAGAYGLRRCSACDYADSRQAELAAGITPAPPELRALLEAL
ncbi:MAG TPA: hypothetical protein VMI75_03505 [Polyangiaceae bacterium]|nr:hypothetical protein [Polyangiaceae bacterium]